MKKNKARVFLPYSSLQQIMVLEVAVVLAALVGCAHRHHHHLG